MKKMKCFEYDPKIFFQDFSSAARNEKTTMSTTQKSTTPTLKRRKTSLSRHLLRSAMTLKQVTFWIDNSN
jgi:hypothetical protein